MVGISTSLTQSMKRTRRLRTEFQEVLDEANWSTTASSFLSEQGALAGDGSRDVGPIATTRAIGENDDARRSL